ncbi:hypothetical protein O9929_14875 [Vibrio lentus]|nr:hypothetical protein [Vibrio lentus]
MAGLQAASELAKLMNESELAAGYLTRSQKALVTVEQSLWDEKGLLPLLRDASSSQASNRCGLSSSETLGLTLTGDARC